ncbi:MAG: 3-oxoacyl-ACP reductase [Gemmatimonadetes bacterium]|uniref:3-oxoacyl-ACP reductase n=1 Tax=marine metagenome TaxID=408172 RepID=A0A381SE84_9ZZZZ|nr:3-oxoacyl-ACP reductase [Gemmatimonadota bacterium]MEC9297715.1 SDR family NAD(P)-dependent oxidoreductase [Gemmatimonadota bacterium]MED5199843.1 SDR family NAD(P)-dependent oxidoreductase [Gemmatimonadota bacterium]|tara:strand:- start:47 stop:781 length:735 start_codon:yes stop_codon:yes gene_type:complete
MKGKTALVTGVAGAIGGAVCRFLAEDGLRLVLVDVDEVGIRRLADELETESYVLPLDVSEYEAVVSGCEKAFAEFGHADVLVNVAGILSNNKLLETDPAEWKRIHAVNLEGPFYLTQLTVPHMKREGWGRIVNISSYAWKSGGLTSGTAYSSSKAGMVGLTFTVAKEVAEFGVTVNGIAPAYVMSPMVMDQLTEEQRQELLKLIPVRRFSEPDEVAHAVRFLVSPLAAFITGEIIDMNGGFQFD